MDIMSLFRGTPAPTTPVPPVPGNPSQVNNPGVALPGTQSTGQTAPNGIIPTQEPAANIPAPEVSPLDAFKDIWQTPTNAAKDDSGPMYGNVNPAELLKSAQKVDFTKSISAANLQAIAGGGEAAVKAFAESLNTVAQQVFAQSTFATTKIVDEAVARSQANFDTKLPSMITRHSVNSGLTDQNPILSNPALAPLVSALNEQLVRKNPNATPGEIQTQIGDYFAALGTSFAPKAPETPQSRAANKAAKSEDWGSFLSF